MSSAVEKKCIIECNKMSKQLINAIFIVNILIIGLKAEFYGNYEPTDNDNNENLELLRLVKNYMERYRALRESGNSQEMRDSWMSKIYNKIEHENRRSYSDNENEWPGRWMPERPSDPTPPPKIYHKTELPESNYRTDSSGRILMGIKSLDCDDGKTNLTVDWNYSPVDYTCYGNKIMPKFKINPQLYCEHIPPSYVAMHRCMQDVIEYDDDIPLYGTHRPIWPIYGEYKFVPRQRWLHNLEHGAVVMLYHPCANPLEVKRLKKLVTGCIRRHIITPSILLDIERPLALITWGCRLSMSYVDNNIVQNFIMEKALKGPEAVERDGDFEDNLLEKAKIVSDIEDSTLCPNFDARNSQNDGRSM